VSRLRPSQHCWIFRWSWTTISFSHLVTGSLCCEKLRKGHSPLRRRSPVLNRWRFSRTVGRFKDSRSLVREMKWNFRISFVMSHLVEEVFFPCPLFVGSAHCHVFGYLITNSLQNFVALLFTVISAHTQQWHYIISHFRGKIWFTWKVNDLRSRVGGLAEIWQVHWFRVEEVYKKI